MRQIVPSQSFEAQSRSFWTHTWMVTLDSLTDFPPCVRERWNIPLETLLNIYLLLTGSTPNPFIVFLYNSGCLWQGCFLWEENVPFAAIFSLSSLSSVVQSKSSSCMWYPNSCYFYHGQYSVEALNISANNSTVVVGEGGSLPSHVPGSKSAITMSKWVSKASFTQAPSV